MGMTWKWVGLGAMYSHGKNEKAMDQGDVERRLGEARRGKGRGKGKQIIDKVVLNRFFEVS
jgi:hypothetical protein